MPKFFNTLCLNHPGGNSGDTILISGIRIIVSFLQFHSNYIIITYIKAARCSKVKVNIISIGNSKGIRIPKILLEQVHLNKEADLVVEGAKLVIRPV